MKRFGLSKSKLLSALQCQKRLWLEVHRPELIPDDPARDRLFSTGHEVGEVARRLAPDGVLVAHQDDLAAALAETRARLDAGGSQLLFEAAIQHDGVLVRTDILELKRGKACICEVKASGSVKDYHLSDAAIQAWVLESAGLRVEAVSIQHIDTSFVYPGDGNYLGLFTDVSVTAEVKPLLHQVPEWVAQVRISVDGERPFRRNVNTDFG
jgi:hypothetical protein